MAAFNPTVPEADPRYAPDFTRSSQAISPYDIRGAADKSKGVAMEGLAKVLPEAVDSAYNVGKQVVESDMNRMKDQSNDAFISALTSMKNSIEPDGIAPGGANASQKPLSLLPEEDTSGTGGLPIEVSKGLDKAETVKNALAAGKISPTAYLANRDAIAKELRSRYPGYRSVIDEKMGNTANQLIHSMITDLNARGGEQEKNRSTIREGFKELRGWPSMNLYEDKWISGDMTDSQARALQNKAFATKATSAYMKEKVEIEKADREQDKYQLEPVINHSIQGMQSAIMEGMDVAVGAYDQRKASDVFKAIQDHADGKDKTTDEQWGQYDQTLRITRAKALSAFMQEMSAHEGGKKSIADRYGAKEIEDAFNANFKVFDAFHDAIHAKDFPLAQSHANALKAMESDFTKNIFNDNDVRENMETLQFLKKYAPEYATKYFANNVWPISDKLTAAMDAQVKLQTLKLTAQKNGENGQYTSFDQGIETLKQKFTKSTPAEAYKSYVDTIQRAADPNADPKIVKNIAHAAFDNSNNSFLNDKNFQRDYTDDKGVYHPGKFRVYETFGNPKIVENVLKLNDPQLKTNMKNWFETTFAHELVPGELKELGGRFSNIPGVTVTYDTETNQFVARGQYAPKGYAERTQTESYANVLNSSLRNINMGLRTLGGVEKATGGDTEAFIVKALRDQGVDPRKIEGFHSQILNAVMSSRQKPAPETPEEALKFAPEGKKGNAASEAIEGAAPTERPNLFSSGRARQMGIAGGLNTHMSNIESQGHTVQVNQEAAPHFKGFLDELAERGYKIDSLLGHNIRGKVIKGRESTLAGYSEHAYGNAIDINPDVNKQGSTKHNFPKDIAEIAARHGLVWGGRWSGSSVDPMHFEWSGRRTQEAGQ